MKTISKKSVRLITVLLCTSVLSGMSVLADDADISPKDQEMQREETIREIGEKSEDAFSFQITNSTGKDIAYINIFEYDESYDPLAETVRLQEALIEQGYLDDVADGLFGPKTQAAVDQFRQEKSLGADGGADKEMLTLLYGEYDDGNLLKDDEIIKSGDTIKLYYTIPADDDTAEEDKEEDAEQFATVPEYHATLKFDGENEEYTLHVLPAEDEAKINIYAGDDFLWAEYIPEGSENLISTYDAEKAEYDRLHPPAVQYNDTYYDDGYYDDGYYDTGYYYEEPYYDGGYEEYYDDGAQGADGCIEDALFW